MLVSQIQRIGQAVHKGEDPVDILVRLQNPIREDPTTKKKIVFIIEAGLNESNNIEFKYELYDFIPEEKLKYLLGLTSGTTTNYSLTLSPSYKKPTKKQREKGKHSIKFDKILSIKKQKINKKRILEILSENNHEEITIVEKILEYLEDNSDQINEAIEKFFDMKGIEKFDNPLIFKLKIGNKSKFLGELAVMKKLYELLNLSDIKVKYKDAKCSLCGSEEGIRDGFNLGFYTLDHEGFRELFFRKEKKMSYQYLMCSDCYLYTLLGFITLREKLNFYAYSLKEGRSSTPVFHYVIPMTKDIELLAKQVDIIAEAKSSFDREIKKRIESRINNLNAQIEQLKREAARETNKKINKELEKKQKGLVENLNSEKEKLEYHFGGFTIKEFIEQLEKRKQFIPILDIYYKITNQKLTPKTKEIVSEIFMSSQHIQKLAKIFKVVKSSKKSKSLKLWTLKSLIPTRKFLHYYSALLDLQPIYRKNFQKDVSQKLKSQFISNLTNPSDRSWENNHQASLQIYEIYYDLFSEASLWRDE